MQISPVMTASPKRSMLAVQWV